MSLERNGPGGKVTAMTAAQQRSGGVREDYRPPTRREREILELLLSVDGPGIDQLLAQLPFLQAVP
jgi:hypothetical protein